MEDKKNIRYIDSLKGWAILAVIMIHSGAALIPGIVGEIGALGSRGVQLFFLISAFLAWKSLNKQIEKKQDNSLKCRFAWFGARLLRLTPLYYVFLAIYIFLIFKANYPALGGIESITASNVVSHVLFLHAFNPYHVNSIIGVAWYIGDLVIMYAITIFLHKFIKGLEDALAWFCGSVIVGYFLCSVLNAAYLIDDVSVWSSYIWTFSIFVEFPCYLLGIVVYYIIQSETVEHMRGNKKLSRVILIGSLYVLFCLVTGYRDIGSRYNAGLSSIWIFSIVYAFIIIALEIRDNKIINNCICAALGRRSYAIYFVHYILICAIQKNIPNIVQPPLANWFIKFVIVVVTSYVIAIILDLLIEKPFNKLWKKLFARRSATERG